jgi:L-ascorbate metabolism protein UlaG (beta-lactamase superfamily)
LNAVGATNATIIAPSVVLPMLSAQLRAKTIVLANGRSTNVAGVTIEAIGMYNITAGRNNHTKGVGNGYVLTLGDRRIYISGDTEDVPEMRALEGIDVAFVCMNLPFTMDVNQAANAVREFRPRMVYPYHYRGSDVTRFKQLVGPAAGVEVRLRNWY